MRYSGELLPATLVVEAQEALRNRSIGPSPKSRLHEVTGKLRSLLSGPGLWYFVYPVSGEEQICQSNTGSMPPLGRESLIISRALSLVGSIACQHLDQVHMEPLRPGSSGKAIQQLYSVYKPCVHVEIPPEALSEILVVGSPDVKNLMQGGHMINPAQLATSLTA